MSKELILTALDEAWKPGSQVILLGEWCRRKTSVEVVPYHWDDQSKFVQDFHFLNDIYEILLKDLSDKLNEIHGLTFSQRYWRILIGPWLGMFTQIVFDRYSMLKVAFKDKNISCARVVNFRELIPTDNRQFIKMAESDVWNNQIYFAILAELNLPTKLLDVPHLESDFSVKRRERNLRSFLSTIFHKAQNRFRLHFLKEDDAFLISTYLPWKIERQLQKQLGQSPIRWEFETAPQVEFDKLKRTWNIEAAQVSEFESLMRKLIPQQIPTVYLEGFLDLQEVCKEVPWPQNPKLIFTSTAFISDDVFKAWAGLKVESGCPYFLGQHGGHYGTGELSFSEDHQYATADYFLSFGWEDPQRKKIIPVGQFKVSGQLGVDHSKNKNLLLVIGVMSRYSQHLLTSVHSSQWLEYFDNQYSFIRDLQQEPRENVIVRLYPNDYGWDQKARFTEQFPSLRFDQHENYLEDSLADARLFIGTYNATTYLESFTMNVPTVLFWNPKYWALRSDAVNDFEELRKAKILHNTPEEAAAHVNLIWNDINGWWLSESVQKAKNDFCSKYSYTPPSLVNRIEEVLLSSI